MQIIGNLFTVDSNPYTQNLASSPTTPEKGVHPGCPNHTSSKRYDLAGDPATEPAATEAKTDHPVKDMRPFVAEYTKHCERVGSSTTDEPASVSAVSSELREGRPSTPRATKPTLDPETSPSSYCASKPAKVSPSLLWAGLGAPAYRFVGRNELGTNLSRPSAVPEDADG